MLARLITARTIAKPFTGVELPTFPAKLSSPATDTLDFGKASMEVTPEGPVEA